MFVKRKGCFGKALFPFLAEIKEREAIKTSRLGVPDTKAEVKGKASEKYMTLSCLNLHIGLPKSVTFGPGGFDGQGTTWNE